MQPDSKSFITREEWDMAVAEGINQRLIEKTGAGSPPFRISPGFPPGARGPRTNVNEQQCWSGTHGADGIPQVFINPGLVENNDVLSAIAHQMLHLKHGPGHARGSGFSEDARKFGFDGSPGNLGLGEELMQFFDRLTDSVGPFSDVHSGIDIKARTVQPTGLKKVFCRKCGYSTRSTQKWAQMSADGHKARREDGTWVCPMHDMPSGAGPSAPPNPNEYDATPQEDSSGGQPNNQAGEDDAQQAQDDPQQSEVGPDDPVDAGDSDGGNTAGGDADSDSAGDGELPDVGDGADSGDGSDGDSAGPDGAGSRPGDEAVNDADTNGAVGPVEDGDGDGGAVADEESAPVVQGSGDLSPDVPVDEPEGSDSGGGAADTESCADCGKPYKPGVNGDNSQCDDCWAASRDLKRADILDDATDAPDADAGAVPDAEGDEGGDGEQGEGDLAGVSDEPFDAPEELGAEESVAGDSDAGDEPAPESDGDDSPDDTEAREAELTAPDVLGEEDINEAEDLPLEEEPAPTKEARMVTPPEEYTEQQGRPSIDSIEVERDHSKEKNNVGVSGFNTPGSKPYYLSDADFMAGCPRCGSSCGAKGCDICMRSHRLCGGCEAAGFYLVNDTD